MSLEAKIAAICKSAGVTLYDTETAKDHGRNVFRVYITAEGGVTVDQCVRVSHLLSPLLDVEEPMSGEYNLEVSSPGIERSLKKPAHFTASVGEKIKISLEGSEKAEGTLVAADEEGITLQTEEGEQRFAYPAMKKARTLFEW